MREILTTSRLKLQKPDWAELEEYYQLCSKPEVNIYNPAGPDANIEVSKEKFAEIIAGWERNKIGYYFARILETDEYVGYIGVCKIEFLGQEMLNLAYRIEPRFQRYGYTYEACQAVLAAVKADHPGLPIRVLTKKNNLPSFGLAEKLGYIYNPKFDNYPDSGDVYLFNVSREVSDCWSIPG